ncbi:hypothetical protein AVEN_271323-1 [Araneus ventricosus]|uniref:Uncharacterized protein n=1 Tax=Araneus ventricosus TaxID=182803 RepID=A0A4Y2WGB6_ARAVE|nr:hypothetical protein AVEN_271323-1 [Araneus ventricosus]
MQGKHVTQVTGTTTLAQISYTNRQQFPSNNSTITFNIAQLTSFPARTADETPKSFLEGLRTPFIYPRSTGCYVTWKYLAHSSISSLNGDIEKMIAYSGIFDLSSRSGVQAWALPVSSCLPL